MTTPTSHEQFLVSDAALAGLRLHVREGEAPDRRNWRRLTSASQAWQLWQGEGDRLMLEAVQQSPPGRHVVVDATFTSGEVVCEPAPAKDLQRAFFPLEYLDVLFYANWLAAYGDLLLHAAAVLHDGAAYCFAGPSGVGKSTLAAAISTVADGTVLAEDRVALRRLDGRFWLFGTPWHFTPAACSPLGAPLARLYFLERACGRGAQPCSRLDGISRLLRTAFVPYYRPELVPRILDNLSFLADQVPFFRLDYLLGSDVLALIRES